MAGADKSASADSGPEYARVYYGGYRVSSASSHIGFRARLKLNNKRRYSDG